MKKYMAELLGTATLVLMGCWSAVIAGESIWFLGISLAFWLTLIGLIAAFWHISWAHFNPAVSVGMWVAGRMKWPEVFRYIVAQSIGAIIWAGVLYFIISGKLSVITSLGQNGFGEWSPSSYNMLSAFVTEAVMTFLFVRIILWATSSKADGTVAALAIGLTLAVIHLVTIPITGTSVNPARSLGPAFWVGGLALSQLWLFWIAPLFWAILAGASYSLSENKN